MPLEFWLGLALFGVPVAMIGFVVWATMSVGAQMDPEEDPNNWGAQDIDRRMKD